jgi:iron(III) transport system substrate-binding protein
MGEKLRAPRFTARIVAAATALVAVAAMLSGCTSGSQGQASSVQTDNGPLGKLIADAQHEGKVTLYAVMDERIVQRVQTAFRNKYHVDMSYVRATAADIAQRFSAEAQAKAPVADVVLDLNDGFIVKGLKDGAFLPLEKANIPGYPNALAPEALLSGTAQVQIAQFAIGFNTDNVHKVSGWKDLLDPALKGKLALATPDSAVYNTLYYCLQREYGMQYLTDLKPQIGRVYSSGSQIIEALGSGEQYAVPGTLAAAVDIAKTQGAPVGSAVPSPTLNIPALMAVNANAPHSAAARLLAYFLTTQDGLSALNDGPGLAAPTSSSVLKTGWNDSPELDAEAAAHKTQIKQALGLG